MIFFFIYLYIWFLIYLIRDMHKLFYLYLGICFMWKNMLEKSICSIFFIAKGKIWHAIEYKHWIIEKGRWIHMNNEKWFWMMEKIDFSPFVKINLVNREIFYYYLFIIFVVAVVVIFYYYYLKKNMSFLYFCIWRPRSIGQINLSWSLKIHGTKYIFCF